MIDLTKGKISREARHIALQKARSYPVSSPLRIYYWSLAKDLQDLEKGKYDDEGAPFICAHCLDELDENLAVRFRDIWGREIGQFGTDVYCLVSKLKEILDRSK